MPRQPKHSSPDQAGSPESSDKRLLDIRGLKKYFPIKKEPVVLSVPDSPNGCFRTVQDLLELVDVKPVNPQPLVK